MSEPTLKEMMQKVVELGDTLFNEFEQKVAAAVLKANVGVHDLEEEIQVKLGHMVDRLKRNGHFLPPPPPPPAEEPKPEVAAAPPAKPPKGK